MTQPESPKAPPAPKWDPAARPQMRLVDLDQNSDAWLEWWRTGIGSSDAPAVLNMSPWKTRRELWEEKVLDYHKSRPVLPLAVQAKIREERARREGQNESSKNRGKKLEPVAREMYERWMGFEVPPVCGVHPEFEFLKVSLDGWHAGRLLFAEIKCPNQKAHAQALDGAVPDYYVPQVLHQFATSCGRECHYISYHDRFPPGQRLAVVPVNSKTSPKALGEDIPLGDLVELVRDKLCEFWASVVTGEYVPLPDEKF